MKHQRLLQYLLIFLVSLAMLTGCGSSSSHSGGDKNTSNTIGVPTPTPTAVSTATPTPTPHKTKGYLIDSPLVGVTYSCDGSEGLTDNNGMFECVNTPITFKIGNLTLGTVTAFTSDGKVYPQDLLGLNRANFTNSRLKLLARLLQSLDDDGVIADKIMITQGVRDGITDVQDFKNMSQNDVKALLIGIDKSLPKECEALKHLGGSVNCGSDGSYYVPSSGGGGSASGGTPPITQKNNLKITLKTTEKIAGYEVHLKFTNDTPSSVSMDNSFLGTTGRTVNNLGADINSSTKEVKFGGFTFGSQEGVMGEFDILTFKTKDSKGQVSIIKQSCVDKDANDVSCDIEIK